MYINGPGTGAAGHLDSGTCENIYAWINVFFVNFYQAYRRGGEAPEAAQTVCGGGTPNPL